MAEGDCAFLRERLPEIDRLYLGNMLYRMGAFFSNNLLVITPPIT